VPLPGHSVYDQDIVRAERLHRAVAELNSTGPESMNTAYQPGA
jgi:hypothetical protein